MRQWLFGSFCPSSPLGGNQVHPKIFNNSHYYWSSSGGDLLHVHHGKWARCHEEHCCHVLTEWVDKCYMSASCLKMRCMISLSSGPPEITVGDERRARLSQQTPARGTRSTMESCNFESNELSMTSVSLSERRRRDGSRQQMLMLCSYCSTKNDFSCWGNVTRWKEGPNWICKAHAEIISWEADDVLAVAFMKMTMQKSTQRPCQIEKS